MYSIDVFSFQHIGTTMIIEKEGKRRYFPPKKVSQLIDYSKSNEWEFPDDSIDIVVLNTEEKENNILEPKGTESKLVKYQVMEEPVIKKLFKITVAHMKNTPIYLFDDYHLFKTDPENGTTLTRTPIEEIVKGDSIYCRLLTTISSSLQVIDIENLGEYEIDQDIPNDVYLVKLQSDKNEIISIGTESVEIYIAKAVS